MSLTSAAVLPEAIADDLRAGIIAQRDAPGTALTESSVALRFGVARPTARLAIDRLVADGILRREAHRAARVPELSRDDIAELFDARTIIEAAAMAALATEGTIPAPALAAHRTLAASEQFAAHDVAFHRALVSGQSNSRLTRMHELIMGEVELCIGQVQAAQLLSAPEVARQHQAILDAITAGDADAASELTRAHISGARDRLLAHVDHSRIDRPHN